MFLLYVRHEPVKALGLLVVTFFLMVASLRLLDLSVNKVKKELVFVSSVREETGAISFTFFAYIVPFFINDGKILLANTIFPLLYVIVGIGYIYNPVLRMFGWRYYTGKNLRGTTLYIISRKKKDEFNERFIGCEVRENIVVDISRQ